MNRGHRPAAGGHLLSREGLRRAAVALGAALVAGALAYLAVRGVGAALLFVQQQQVLQEVAGTLSGGIEGLGSSDLRAARRELQRLAAEYERRSIIAGGAAAAVTALAVYLRLADGP